MSNLTERAMLVRFSAHLPQKSKHDKELSAETTSAHGADIEMGKFTKQLFAKASVARLNSAATALRVFWETQTLPWHKGVRILPSKNYFAATQRHSQLAVEFDAARDEFLDTLDSSIEDARRRLNGMFRESDYPSRSRMAKRIGIDLGILPLPRADDFRVELGADEERRIREQIERDSNAALERAMGDLWQRTHDVVKEMLDKLSRYAVDPVTGKTVATFRDSAVENLREMVSLLDRLNVTEDPELESMRQRLSASLCAHDAEVLRDSQPLRESAIDECKAVLAAMAGYCGNVDLDLAAE